VTTAVILLAVIVNYIAKRVLLGILSFVIRRTRTTWDDALLERRVLQRAAHIAPALVFYWFSAAFPGIESLIQQLSMVYMLVVAGLVVNGFFNALLDVYHSLEVSRNRPIKGFVQIVQLVVFVFLAVLAIAALFDQSPFGLLGGLGAMTAVLLLVFKDPILGLVASFQITGSNMVRLGDWIEMPKYGADGDVIDISLLQIKVQNWDKTISTIPTYALVSDSFKNWRGMSESGGRRIKRSINIDMTSVKFCDEEMLRRFSKYQHIAAYIQQKKDELARFNQDSKVDLTQLVNGRRLTNVGTFRAYVVAYLQHHPQIHQGMTFLVRQLQPGPHGLPIEVYVFSKDQVWANYEGIQADIFDHILAVVPHFDLRVYQNPSGSDLQSLLGLAGAVPIHNQERSE
jgi:miniconductance mechanosensitive channel